MTKYNERLATLFTSGLTPFQREHVLHMWEDLYELALKQAEELEHVGIQRGMADGLILTALSDFLLSQFLAACDKTNAALTPYQASETVKKFASVVDISFREIFTQRGVDTTTSIAECNCFHCRMLRQAGCEGVAAAMSQREASRAAVAVLSADLVKLCEDYLETAATVQQDTPTTIRVMVRAACAFIGPLVVMAHDGMEDMAREHILAAMAIELKAYQERFGQKKGDQDVAGFASKQTRPHGAVGHQEPIFGGPLSPSGREDDGGSAGGDGPGG